MVAHGCRCSSPIAAECFENRALRYQNQVRRHTHMCRNNNVSSFVFIFPFLKPHLTRLFFLHSIYQWKAYTVDNASTQVHSIHFPLHTPHSLSCFLLLLSLI